jgi:hypothetical protein
MRLAADQHVEVQVKLVASSIAEYRSQRKDELGEDARYCGRFASVSVVCAPG